MSLDALRSNMEAFDGALARLMPADMAEKYRLQAAQAEARNAALADKIRTESAEVISLLAEAILRPAVCREELKRALSHLSVALVAAHELDPEDEIEPSPRFANVSCSHCGCSFGPGDSGFSHCEDHRHLQSRGR